MSPDWTLVTRIETTGTVTDFGGSPEAGSWLAAPAGLFHLNGTRWQPRQRALPFWHVTAVAAAAQNVLAGGLPQGVVRSQNGGQQWHTTWIEQTQAPVTCLVPSPGVAQDGVWLAGTRGDGILRATDGGRHWHLSNWGLRDFTVVDLITAPAWNRREYAWAVTLEGIYQSPNGGRAWRLIETLPPQTAPQALAVSPNFEEDETVWLGTEAGKLFRSTDKGRQWQPLLPPERPSWDTINSLLALPGGDLLLAAGEDGIWWTAADGAAWQRAAHPALEAGQQVLRLRRVNGVLYAGLWEGGAWHSLDSGRSWQRLAGLTPARFLWLRPLAGGLVAGGPEAGAWWLPASSTTWQPVAGTALALAAVGNDLVLSRADGVSWGAPTRPGSAVWQPEAPVLQLWPGEAGCWARDRQGALWYGRAPGQKWRQVAAPPGKVLAVAEEAGGTGTACAVHDPARHQIVVYIREREKDWEQAFALAARTRQLQLAYAAGTIWLTTGGSVLRYQEGSLQQTELSDRTARLVAFLPPGDGQPAVTATVDGLWRLGAAGGWEPLPALPPGEAVAALARPEGALYALTSDGRLYRSGESR